MLVKNKCKNFDGTNLAAEPNNSNMQHGYSIQSKPSSNALFWNGSEIVLLYTSPTMLDSTITEEQNDS